MNEQKKTMEKGTQIEKKEKGWKEWKRKEINKAEKKKVTKERRQACEI